MKWLVCVLCLLGCVDQSRTPVNESEIDAAIESDVGVENPFANCSELRDSYDEAANFESCYPAVDETGCLRLRLELANGAWCQLDTCIAQIKISESVRDVTCEFYFAPHEGYSPTSACGCFSQDIVEEGNVLAHGNEVLCTPVYCIY